MKTQVLLFVAIIFHFSLISVELWGQTAPSGKFISQYPEPTINDKAKTKPVKTDGFTITGHIEGIEDGTLVTLYDIEEQIVLDSTFSEKGHFRMSGRVDAPTACWIRCTDQYAIIQVENVDYSFAAPHKDMHLHSVINGGKEQALQNDLQALQQPFNIIYLGALDSLTGQMYTDEKEKQLLIKRYKKAQDAAHKIYINFGKDHPDSYLGLDIIYRNRKSIPKDTLMLIYEHLPSSLKATPKANAINVFLYDAAVEKGQSFIDFTAKTLDDKDFKLSSLAGKYIYLSFWSAGCGPCRMENKFLNQHYDRIPEELAVVSFSIDRNNKVWAKASAVDGIVWHNVSDREGGLGRVKTQYQVQAIPTSFLIDQQGRIMEIFTGFDPDVDLIAEIVNRIEGNK